MNQILENFLLWLETLSPKEREQIFDTLQKFYCLKCGYDRPYRSGCCDEDNS